MTAGQTFLAPNQSVPYMMASSLNLAVIVSFLAFSHSSVTPMHLGFEVREESEWQIKANLGYSSFPE